MTSKRRHSWDIAVTSMFLLPVLAVFLTVILAPVFHSKAAWTAFVVLFGFGPCLVSLVLGITVLARPYPARLLGIVGLLPPLVITVAMVSALPQPVSRCKPRETQCLSKLKRLAMAQLTYASDFDQCLPLVGSWPSTLLPYYNNEPDLLICPADSRHEKQKSGELQTSYTMSSRMSGVNIGDLAAPGEIALLFDGTQLFGSHGAAAFRHSDRLNVALCDGHAKQHSRQEFGQLSFQPSTSRPAQP